VPRSPRVPTPNDPSDDARGAEILPLPWVGRRVRAPAARQVSAADPDDYAISNRTLLAVILFVVGFVVVGVWLLETMRSNAQLEECVMAGRRNCAPIVVPPDR
jgi:hypothetical protein